jgi:hypothetical protein
LDPRFRGDDGGEIGERLVSSQHGSHGARPGNFIRHLHAVGEPSALDFGELRHAPLARILKWDWKTQDVAAIDTLEPMLATELAHSI